MLPITRDSRIGSEIVYRNREAGRLTALRKYSGMFEIRHDLATRHENWSCRWYLCVPTVEVHFISAKNHYGGGIIELLFSENICKNDFSKN